MFHYPECIPSGVPHFSSTFPPFISLLDNQMFHTAKLSCCRSTGRTEEPVNSGARRVTSFGLAVFQTVVDCLVLPIHVQRYPDGMPDLIAPAKSTSPALCLRELGLKVRCCTWFLQKWRGWNSIGTSTLPFPQYYYYSNIRINSVVFD